MSLQAIQPPVRVSPTYGPVIFRHPVTRVLAFSKGVCFCVTIKLSAKKILSLNLIVNLIFYPHLLSGHAAHQSAGLPGSSEWSVSEVPYRVVLFCGPAVGFIYWRASSVLLPVFHIQPMVNIYRPDISLVL